VERPSVEFQVKPTPSLIKELTEIDADIPTPFNFKPTIPLTYGLSGSYKWLGFTIGQASNLSDKELEEKGETDFDDYQLHFSFSKVGVDLIYQDYTGFYAGDEDPLTQLSEPSFQLAAQQFPATTFQRRGANFFYINRPKSFSLAASFDQSEFSKKSGYSWISMLSLERIAIHKIPYILTDVTDPDSGYHYAGFNTYGLKTGPAVTLKVAGVYLSAMTLAGVAYQEQIIQQFETGETDETSAPTLQGHARVAFGFDPGAYFFVATYFIDYTEIPTADYDVFFLSGVGKLAVGSRF
jgi:hypothetical protein